MRGKFQAKASKGLVLVACVALVTGGSGCSLPSLGPFTPLIKMGYNAFATMFNSAFFGAGTSTGITF